MALFRSEEHVARWSVKTGIPVGAVFGVDAMWKLAGLWFHDRLSPTCIRCWEHSSTIHVIHPSTDVPNTPWFPSPPPNGTSSRPLVREFAYGLDILPCPVDP